MVLLARTTPLESVKRPSEGLSLFFIDFDKAKPGVELRRIKKMGGRAVDANEIFFENYRVPASTMIGKEGQGFKMILHGLNAERCLLAGEALGLGYAALKKYVTEPASSDVTLTCDTELRNMPKNALCSVDRLVRTKVFNTLSQRRTWRLKVQN